MALLAQQEESLPLNPRPRLPDRYALCRPGALPQRLLEHRGSLEEAGETGQLCFYLCYMLFCQKYGPAAKNKSDKDHWLILGQSLPLPPSREDSASIVPAL